MGIIEFAQSLLPSKPAAPTAPGNTSNTTIAAAETETQKAAAQTSNSTPQVAPQGSRKQKQFEREYSQTSTSTSSSSSSSSSSSRNVLQEVAKENKPTQTVTEAMRDNSIDMEERAEAVKEVNRIAQQNGAPTIEGLKEAANEYNRQQFRENLIFGNLYTTVETVVKNPDGSVNLQDNIFKQFEEYDAADGSGDYRRAKAVAAAVEVPSYFAGGFVTGGAAKAVSTGINKIGATKIGGKVVDFATTPILKPASIVNPATNPKVAAVVEATTTPTAAAVNIAGGLYLVDAGSRIAAQPTTEKKLEQAGAILLKEIPAGALGAITGYKAVDRAAGSLYTLGKKELPYDKVVAPGIPLGDYKPAQLQASFEQNRLIPEPYKFARAENPKNYRGSVSLNPDATDYLEAWHATANGQYFGKRVTITEGSSEVSGLWTAPKVVENFLGTSESVTPKPSLFVRSFGRSPESKALNIRGDPKLKFLDWDEAAKDAGKTLREVKSNPELRKEVGDAYINKNTEFGELISPSLKNEYEAVLKPGTELKRLRRKYYTKSPSGKVIPIDEYKVTNRPSALEKAAKAKGMELGERLAKRMDRLESKPAKIKTASSEYRTRTPETVPAFSYSRVRVESVKVPDSSRIRVESVKVPDYSSPKSSSRSAVSRVSESVSRSAKSTSSSSISSQKASSNKLISSGYSGYKPNIAEYPGYSRKKEERKSDLDIYLVARRGRVDRLSIVDPAEMLGRGSLTDRTRPDRVFSREVMYITDGQIGTKKPKGRVKK